MLAHKLTHFRSQRDGKDFPDLAKNTQGSAGTFKRSRTLGLSALAVSLALLTGPLRAEFAYVCNVGPNTLSAYHIGANGALKAVLGSPFNTGGVAPDAVAIDPLGRFAYVANGGDATISAFKIALDGALSPVPGSPFQAGTYNNSLAVDVLGRLVYMANGFQGNVLAFHIGPDGALTAVLGSPFPAGQNASSVAVDPCGRFAYVTNVGGRGPLGVIFPPTLLAYRIGSDGSLQQVASSTTGRQPASVAVSALGRFVYVASQDGTVSAYRVDQTTGALTAIPGSPFQAGQISVGVAVDPSGRFAYVANSGDGNVSAFRINPATGVLTQVIGSPFPAGLEPASVAVDPLGQFVYVANYNDAGTGDPGTVSAYRVNPAIGRLTKVGGSPFQTGNGPNSVAISP